MGDHSFYGPGLTVDTKKKFTVVTQFISSDGTASGNLVEIRRLYVQNGVVIQNSKTNIPGMSTYDSITPAFCDAQKAAFGDKTQFQAKGGLTQMGVAAKNGMVLVLSVWDDHAVNMLWLDSTYPTTANATAPGVARGTCATTSGTPTDVEANSPNASVTYSNIRFGEIGSTYTGTVTGTTSVGSTTTSKTSTTTSSTTTKASTTSTSTTTKASTTTSSAPASTSTQA
ncbi:Exoglucanase 1, partial [Arthromyces matolae]